MSERRAVFGPALCGLATSILAALANVGLDNATDLNVFALSIQSILPVGACCVGIVAASGYYAGAVYWDRRPTQSLLSHMVAVTAFTQFLIYFLSYLSVYDDGSGSAEALSFWQFMHHSLETFQVREFGLVPVVSSAELGGWGYLMPLLQFFGLFCGSVTVYYFLQKKQYCDRCGRYLHLLKRVEQFFGGPGPAIAHFDALTNCAVGGAQFARLVTLPAPDPGVFQRGVHRVDTLLLGCPGCQKQMLENDVWVYEGLAWEQDNIHYLDVAVPDGIDLLPVLDGA